MEKCVKSQKIVTLNRLCRTVFGLFLFSFGVYMTICANIGLAPWDALSTGISLHTPLSYGKAHTIVSVLILVTDVLMHEKIGCGTILDAALVGNFADLFLWLGILPPSTSLPGGIFFFIVGLFVMAFGQYFYMSSGQGCGPRDSFLVGLGKRLPKVPIGAVNTMILCVVLVVSWILGGPIGIGTVLATFGIGVALQIVCLILHFEPRAVVHKDVLETARDAGIWRRRSAAP